jgi:hypothetical protein
LRQVVNGTTEVVVLVETTEHGVVEAARLVAGHEVAFV